MENKIFAKPSYDLKIEEIKKLEKKTILISKNVSKKYTSYSVAVNVGNNCLEVANQIEEADYILALFQNDYDPAKVTKVELRAPYRFVKGKKDDNEYYAIDLFVSVDYRPRLFIPSKIMRVINIMKLELPFQEIEIKEADLANFENEKEGN